MALRIGCVVEGHGERESVPVLLRRVAESVDPGLVVDVPQPIRVPKSRLVKAGEIERAVELAARKVGGGGALFVLVDSDDDCPATLGPSMLARLAETRADFPAAVVVAKREFESWFLAAAESLRGCRGMPPDLTGPPDPETVRGSKEWLGARMEEPGGYVETLHQPAFTAVFDLAAARRADSFDKCYRDVVRLIEILRGDPRLRFDRTPMTG